MTQGDILQRIYQAVPALTDQLQLERIEYLASELKAVFHFTSQAFVGREQFAAVKQALRECFAGLAFSLRITAPALAEHFLAQPDAYRDTLGAILAKAFPATVSWARECAWKSENATLVLELPDAFAQEYLKQAAGDQLLQQAIYDLFCIRPPVVLRVKEDTEKRLTRIRQRRQEDARQREQEVGEPKKTTPAKAKPQKAAAKSGAAGRIKGSAISEAPAALSTLTELSGKVAVAGRVLQLERKDIPGREIVLLSFVLTDYTESVRCKVFLRLRQRRYGEDSSQPPTAEEIQAAEQVISQIREGAGLKLRGLCQHDPFDKGLVLMVQDISHYPLPQREDSCAQKRIELHAHTTMSLMDATVSAQDLIKRAADWGHAAIAITDHGVVQAFPEAFAAAKANKIKLIPGMEAYMIDSTAIVQNATARPFADDIVVLDFETTGLNTRADRIIEIGAVKLRDGRIADTFSSFVQPGMALPKIITQITGITDGDLAGAPPAAQILPQLMAFIGDCPLAAHNASFDCAVLKSELNRLSIAYAPSCIDTLFFAQKLYPELTRYRLSAVCKHLGVSLRNAHRAVADATATAQCLAAMLARVAQLGGATLRDIDILATGYTKTRVRHVVLLARNRQGMENLNYLVSQAHLTYFHDAPRVPRDLISAHREGLLVGSACCEGEIYQALANGESAEDVEALADFYDYLEIQPIDRLEPLQRHHLLVDAAQAKQINQKIVALGEKKGLPVIAAGDAHYLDPQDAPLRKILHNNQHDPDCENLPLAHLRTTQEMLDEFASYLGQEKAHEVVVEQPQRLAAMVEEVSLFPPHPEQKTTFLPVWEDAPDDIRNMTEAQARALYGQVLPEVVRKRIDHELKAIIGYGFATLYSIANKLVTKSLADGYMVGSRGSVGSSLVARLCNITEVNPLPAHYRCAHCHAADFAVPANIRVGIDLPDKACPICGKNMLKDGFDIPFEVFLGFKGDKVPDIDLNFSGEYQARAHAYIEELFGKGSVFRAGTIGTLKEKTAYGIVLQYMQDRAKAYSAAEISRLAHGCEGVKRTTGQHPGGIVVLPKEYKIEQFTAVQHPADAQDSSIITTHYDFGSMHDVLLKLDVLGHDDPTMIHHLEQLTGVRFEDIPLDDPQVFSLFTDTQALGVGAEEIGSQTGTLGVPEFGTSFVRQMLIDTKPKRMEDLIRVSGLSHGTDVWLGNAKELIQSKTAALDECICTREDIMNYLITIGMETKIAFDIMESVRKGKKLKADMEEAMIRLRVPEWFIESCKKIGYLFPKGHAVAYVIMALRVAWHKLYRPLAYYAAYFSIRCKAFDALKMIAPKETVRSALHVLNQKDSKDLTGKEKDEIVALEMVIEMLCRGFAFLPPDLYRSDVTMFLLEGDALRAPLTSMPGFGEAAANSIVQTRHDPFVSIEDLSNRTRITSTGIEMLRAMGALGSLSATNQVDFFSML